MSYGYPGYNNNNNNNHNNNSSMASAYPGASSYPGAGGSNQSHQQNNHYGHQYPGGHNNTNANANASFAGPSAPNTSFAQGGGSSYPYPQGGSTNLNASHNNMNASVNNLNNTQHGHSGYANQYPHGSPVGTSQQQQSHYPGAAAAPPQQQQQQQPTPPPAPSAAPAHPNSQYPRADGAYASQHQHQHQANSHSSPLAPMNSYFATFNLPEVHRSEATADPDKPLDIYEYLHSRGFKDEQILAARHEHVDPEPDMCLEDTELRDYGGNSIFCFFKFCKYIAFLVFIFFCLSVINFGIYAGEESPDFSNDPQRVWYADFFISSYTKDQRDAWLGTTIVCVIFMFFAAPCYYRYIGNYTFEDDNRTLSSIEEDAVAAGNVEDAITRFNDDGSIDVSARYRTYTNVAIRRFISLLVFAAFIGVQVGASIGITRIESASRGAGPAFAVAFIAAILNMIYQVMARQLTEFERWTEIGSADKSLTLKLILFKLANVIAVYGSKQYPKDRCVYEIVGEQFLTLLLVEIVFVIPGTLVGAALLTRFHQLYGSVLGSINGDARHMAQFEMAIEYLSTLYKFYLGCMALVVFPLSTVLSIVCMFFNFWAARYRLIKICSKPIRSSATMKGTVTVVMILIFFAVLFTPFAGSIWIMAGWSTRRTTTSFFCGINDK